MIDKIYYNERVIILMMYTLLFILVLIVNTYAIENNINLMFEKFEKSHDILKKNPNLLIARGTNIKLSNIKIPTLNLVFENNPDGLKLIYTEDSAPKENDQIDNIYWNRTYLNELLKRITNIETPVYKDGYYNRYEKCINKPQTITYKTKVIEITNKDRIECITDKIGIVYFNGMSSNDAIYIQNYKTGILKKYEKNKLCISNIESENCEDKKLVTFEWIPMILKKLYNFNNLEIISSINEIQTIKIFNTGGTVCITKNKFKLKNNECSQLIDMAPILYCNNVDCNMQTEYSLKISKDGKDILIYKL